MNISLFNCWMIICYVLKNQGFNYGNYNIKQLMTVKYKDCRVLQKLTRQVRIFNMSLYHYTVFSIHGKFLFPFTNFPESRKRRFCDERNIHNHYA